MAKLTITHALAFILGIGTGMLIVAKGCPPVPVPAAQPAPPQKGPAPIDGGPLAPPAEATR